MNVTYKRWCKYCTGRLLSGRGMPHRLCAHPKHRNSYCPCSKSTYEWCKAHKVKSAKLCEDGEAVRE